MIQAHASLLFHRPAGAFFENYPKWFPEVLELEPRTPGPVELGPQARHIKFASISNRTRAVFLAGCLYSVSPIS
jgi:hypothetical protein